MDDGQPLADLPGGGGCGYTPGRVKGGIALDAEGHTTAIGALIAVVMAMVGLFAWFVKRIVDKTIPDMVGDFTKALTEERASCERRHAETQAALALERQANERRHADNVANYVAVMDGHKETRHAIRELQNEAHLHRALIDQAMKLREQDLLPPEKGGKPC